MFYLFTLSILATVALLCWLFILLRSDRAWDFQIVGDDDLIGELPAGIKFPPVTIIVPARNEALSTPTSNMRRRRCDVW
ncbi:MAG: hypothetical protein V1899_05865 [Planctomycetota bacterium]